LDAALGQGGSAKQEKAEENKGCSEKRAIHKTTTGHKSGLVCSVITPFLRVFPV
jgi:hypothetical protein